MLLKVQDIATIFETSKHFGRLNDPTRAAVIQGPCDDVMEFYLVINDHTTKGVQFFTEGCAATVACSEMIARLAAGKSVDEALCISPAQVKDLLTDSHLTTAIAPSWLSIRSAGRSPIIF